MITLDKDIMNKKLLALIGDKQKLYQLLDSQSEKMTRYPKKDWKHVYILISKITGNMTFYENATALWCTFFAQSLRIQNTVTVTQIALMKANKVRHKGLMTLPWYAELSDNLQQKVQRWATWKKDFLVIEQKNYKKLFSAKERTELEESIGPLKRGY